MRPSAKTVSITLLVLAEFTGMIPWFAAAAVLPDIAREGTIGPARQALLSSGVQAGFVIGALAISISGLADRFDPRKVFAVSAVAAAAMNAMLLALPLGGDLAIGSRFLVGAFLAGVYPVGMKIAVGWGSHDRGLLVGLLVGALTLGKSVPYLSAFLGGTDWRAAIAATSIMAALGGVLALLCRLGPGHARAPRFEPQAIKLAWTNRRIRSAYAGYLGHMWELFAMWAWVGAATAASYAATLDQAAAEERGKLTAFLAIGLGALTCVAGGLAADRIGKAEVTIIALAISGSCAILTGLSFGGPAWITFMLALVWGMAVIPDSAQFSAVVADNAPAHLTGSLLTFQTALGFALTAVTVQLTPAIAGQFGWPITLSGLAIGPAIGIAAMLPLRRGRTADGTN
jgi:MFS family permease